MDEDVQYMHMNIGEGKLTAALKISQKEHYPKVNVAVSFCSPKDQFNKKIGRDIAEGRLKKGKHFFVDLPVDLKKSVKSQVAAYLQRNFANGDKRFPGWAAEF